MKLCYNATQHMIKLKAAFFLILVSLSTPAMAKVAVTIEQQIQDLKKELALSFPNNSIPDNFRSYSDFYSQNKEAFVKIRTSWENLLRVIPERLDESQRTELSALANSPYIQQLGLDYLGYLILFFGINDVSCSYVLSELQKLKSFYGARSAPIGLAEYDSVLLAYYLAIEPPADEDTRNHIHFCKEAVLDNNFLLLPEGERESSAMGQRTENSKLIVKARFKSTFGNSSPTEQSLDMVITRVSYNLAWMESPPILQQKDYIQVLKTLAGRASHH